MSADTASLSANNGVLPPDMMDVSADKTVVSPDNFLPSPDKAVPPADTVQLSRVTTVLSGSKRPLPRGKVRLSGGKTCRSADEGGNGTAKTPDFLALLPLALAMLHILPS